MRKSCTLSLKAIRPVLAAAMAALFLLPFASRVGEAVEERPESLTFDMLAAGAAGDGVTDDTEHFSKALELLAGRPGTIEIRQGTFAVTSLTFPANTTLSFRNGGKLAIASDAVVEILGAVDAGIHALFTGEGRVSGRVNSLYIYPQWFGAVGDGVHDDARAIQQAADLAASSTGGTLFIPGGEYRFHSNISFRCNVESHGLFIKEIEIDEERTTFCNDLFLPTHYPKSDPYLLFEPDHPAVALAPEAFYGLEEGDLTVPQYRQLPLAEGGGYVDLEEGGVLRFHSTDFFSSRNVRKGDHYYDRNDICQIVSGRGAVFPEFAFSYSAPPDAEPWHEETVYAKGDYCSFEGRVFKATWGSGPGSLFRHRHHGEVPIGAVPPNANAENTDHGYAYPDGTPDSIRIWRRLALQVWYRPKDKPVTVNGLRLELRLNNHGGETKRIEAGAVIVSRSNMTFNNIEASVRDREATLSRLFQVSSCVNIEFNNGYFSGATSAHLGYNILNSNVANLRYNNCTSTNSRKGMDGRHGKNIVVNGGYYNIIDDHYGRNYVIRDAVLSGLSVFVPGDSSPRADLQAWEFRSRGAISFNGANFHIENVTVFGAGGGILAARTDIGDLYGDIVLKDISIRGNTGDVQLFTHLIMENFDYAHDVRMPHKLTIDNIRLERPGRVNMMLGSGFGNRPYGPVHVSNTENVGNVFNGGPDTHFHNCSFRDSRFLATPQGLFNFWNCTFSGDNTGLKADQIGVATGNVTKKGANTSFPIEYLNESIYEGRP